MSISGYKIVWLQVSFDLPTNTKIERKIASNFRDNLLKNGFEMSQFSIYMRFCKNKESSKKFINRIRKFVPKNGKVHILAITDKQYENIITFHGENQAHFKKKPPRFKVY